MVFSYTVYRGFLQGTMGFNYIQKDVLVVHGNLITQPPVHCNPLRFLTSTTYSYNTSTKFNANNN